MTNQIIPQEPILIPTENDGIEILISWELELEKIEFNSDEVHLHTSPNYTETIHLKSVEMITDGFGVDVLQMLTGKAKKYFEEICYKK